MDNWKGSGAVFLSSVLFGVTPIFARLTYEGGNTSLQMVFLRSFLALPVLFMVLRLRGVSLKVSGRELGQLALGGFFGSSATTICLYASYRYIPVGVATSINFAYPLLVALASVLLFHEPLVPQKAVVLLCGLAGVFLLMDGGGVFGVYGILFALASAFTFAFKVIWMDKSVLSGMHSMKVAFYFCICDCISSGLIGAAVGQFPRTMTPVSWGYALLVSMLLSVGAVPLLKYGIGRVGASIASILSTMEPITSVAVGILVLREDLSVRKGLGCLLIISGVILTSFIKNQKAGLPRKTT